MKKAGDFSENCSGCKSFADELLGEGTLNSSRNNNRNKTTNKQKNHRYPKTKHSKNRRVSVLTFSVSPVFTEIWGGINTGGYRDLGWH